MIHYSNFYLLFDLLRGQKGISETYAAVVLQLKNIRICIRINISGVKIRPVIKKQCLSFHKVQHIKT